MTFELVRIGWPNTAAILTLAWLPAVATVASLEKPQLPAAGLSLLEPATSCPDAGQGDVLLTATEPTATLR
jgi:hypothetical protein